MGWSVALFVVGVAVGVMIDRFWWYRSERRTAGARLLDAYYDREEAESGFAAETRNLGLALLSGDRGVIEGAWSRYRAAEQSCGARRARYAAAHDDFVAVAYPALILEASGLNGMLRVARLDDLRDRYNPLPAKALPRLLIAEADAFEADEEKRRAVTERFLKLRRNELELKNQVRRAWRWHLFRWRTRTEQSPLWVRRLIWWRRDPPTPSA